MCMTDLRKCGRCQCAELHRDRQQTQLSMQGRVVHAKAKQVFLLFSKIDTLVKNRHAIDMDNDNTLTKS